LVTELETTGVFKNSKLDSTSGNVQSTLCRSSSSCSYCWSICSCNCEMRACDSTSVVDRAASVEVAPKPPAPIPPELAPKHPVLVTTPQACSKTPIGMCRLRCGSILRFFDRTRIMVRNSENTCRICNFCGCDLSVHRHFNVFCWTSSNQPVVISQDPFKHSLVLVQE